MTVTYVAVVGFARLVIALDEVAFVVGEAAIAVIAVDAVAAAEVAASS